LSYKNYINTINSGSLTKSRLCDFFKQSLSVTHPQLKNIFINLSDFYSLSYGSSKYVEIKCPDCGNIKRVMVNYLTKHGVGCSCSDGLSYPTKFIYNLLSQLKIKDFNTEKSFKWSNRKRYDYYLNKQSLIIEVNGKQHYEIDGFIYLGGRTLQQEEENDIVKRDLAIKNDIKYYIVIDARFSEVDWIKKSILNSGLPNILNFKESDIDWLECHEYALSNLIREICKYKACNQNCTTGEISNKFNISAVTIQKYLKQGTKIGLCDYNPKQEMINCGQRNGGWNKKQVIMLKDGKEIGIFSCANDIARESLKLFNIELKYKCILAAASNNHPMTTYKGFVFQYIN